MPQPDKRHRWDWIIHLFVIWSLAVAQPIYDLLGRYPEFFVARRTQPFEIYLLIGVLSLLCPALLAMALAISLPLGNRIFARVWRVVLGLLVFLTVLPIAKRLPEPELLYSLGAAATGLAAFWGYPRLRALRLFLTYLCPVIVVFPAYFLFFTPVQKLAFPAYLDPRPPQGPGQLGTTQTPSVVILVLDELALSTLLDEAGQVDSHRFPNFARLAAESTWYRNATTVADSTHNALPAIATGLYPRLGTLGTSTDYPENLFTWLSRTHRLQVFEAITQLCPITLCPPRITAPWPTRLSLMGEDLLVLYGHLVIPAPINSRLPSIDQGWGNFRRQDWQLQRSLAFYRSGEATFEKFLQGLDESEEPTLFFYHAALPHFPWVFLPSGRRYSTRSLASVFLQRDRWAQQPAIVTHGFQRYQLQLGFTDRQLGRMLDQLERTGLDRSSLLIVMADHGVSFFPGQARRAVNSVTAPEILRIPLFVRLPGQVKSQVNDLNVETVDLIPSLRDALHIPLPWQPDGQSIWDQKRNKSGKLLFRQGQPYPYHFSTDAVRQSGPVICWEGRALPVEIGQLVGSVDAVRFQNGQVFVSGFAANLAESRPADRVLIFVNQELVHVATPDRERRDVVDFFKNPDLSRSGFLIKLDQSLFLGQGKPKARFFALGGDFAGELQYQAGYPWSAEWVGPEVPIDSPQSFCEKKETADAILIPLAQRRWVARPESQAFRRHLQKLATSAGPDCMFRAVEGAEALDRAISELDSARPIAAQLRDASLYDSVDPDGSFVPAEVDATFAPSEVTSGELVLIALNGFVRAVAHPFPWEKQTRVLAVLPEDRFQKGANTVDLYAWTPP